jgi:hypothetical protein
MELKNVITIYNSKFDWFQIHPNLPRIEKIYAQN